MDGTATARVLVGLTAAAAAGCGPGGSGGTGDPPNDPVANVYGTGSRIHEIVGPATWLDPTDEESVGCVDVPLDRKVNVTGAVILAEDRFDETGAGAAGNLYVQDAALRPEDPTFAGVTVFQPGFSPPDLRVSPGDVMDLFGLLTEFEGPTSSKFPYCRTLPELTGAMEFRFEGALPDPAPMPVSALASYEVARPYFGMLVRLENVELRDDPYDPGTGRVTVRIRAHDMDTDIPEISNELYDLKAAGPALMRGMVLQSLTGIVTFFYGVRVAPRSPADIVL
jgi:hypothetical protein